MSLSSSYEAAKEAYNKAVDAATKATSYMDFIPKIGLIVSDLRNSDSTDFVLGRNILIDSNSVDIRNGETVLASYGDNYIQLAKNNAGAIIDLCAGSAMMRLITTSTDWSIFNISSPHSLELSSDAEIHMDANHSYYPSEDAWLENPNSYERQISGMFRLVTSDQWTINDPDSFTPYGMMTLRDEYINGEIHENSLDLNGDHLVLRDYYTDGVDYMKTASISLWGETEGKSKIEMCADEILLNGYQSWGYGFAETDTSKTYPGLIRPDGSDTGYVRTPQTGLLPYKNGGHGTIGTSSWPFNNGYINNGYFKNIDVSGVRINSSKNIVLTNNKGIFSDTADGTATRSLLFLNGANECIVGYGGWTNDEGTTRIYGKQVKVYSKDSNANFRLDATKPYYEAGDSISTVWWMDGFISSSKGKVYFTIPLAKPVVGNPTITVTSNSSGLTVRQYNPDDPYEGKYVYSGKDGTKPSSYSGALNSDGNAIKITATMPNTTNVLNNIP